MTDATSAVARVVVAALEQQVRVDSVEGADGDGGLVFDELVDQRVEHERAQLALDADGVALHQGLGVLEERVVLAFGRWILVIPVDVLAVVARAPPPRVAAKPCTVGVQGRVIPVVPGEEEHEQGVLLQRAMIDRVAG